MSEDWRTKAVKDFCLKHNATVTVFDDLKTTEQVVILRKDDHEVVRRIFYGSIPTSLPTVLLNEMLHEIQEKEGE